MEKPSNGSGHDSGGPEAAGHSRPNGDVFDIAARVGPIPSHVYAIVYPASELRGHRLDALVRWSADVGTCVPSDFKLHAISPSDLAIPMLRRQRDVLAARLALGPHLGSLLDDTPCARYASPVLAFRPRATGDRLAACRTGTITPKYYRPRRTV